MAYGISRTQSLGSRRLHFGPELYIERSDFEEEPPKKFKRLSPGEMVRPALWLHYSL